MMYLAFILICLGAVVPPTMAQKVGVVLSGGGAKGLAHIGVLKALEENDIPVDYIVGTSMGGIIAGSYAAGISPHQLEDIILSDEFLNWVHGKAENRNSYNYGKRESDPSFVRLALSLNPKLTLSPNMLNSSIAADWAINFALAETVAQSESIYRSHFDSLFIPLRIVGADIFTQHETVFDSGILSDALRVTQTVPFFYQPIKVNNKYLFDGGLYNNFPIDVMQSNFESALIIGSNVSTQVYDKYPYNEDEELISKVLPFILLDKSDPSKLSEDDIYIQPDLKGYTAFDFQKGKNLIDSGYMQTLRQIELIKTKIKTKRSCESVAAARNTFNNRAKPILFNRILFEGFKKGQQRYLLKLFRKKKVVLPFSKIKSGYYKLMSETHFRNIYPNILYDSVSQYFDLKLTNRSKTNFELNIGGAIANRNVSTVFFGIHYFYFTDIFLHSSLNVYIGNFHKSIAARLRIYMPLLNQIYFEPQFVFNSWNILQDKGIMADSRSLTILNSMDYKAGLDITMLVGKQYKASLYSYYVSNRDEYVNGETLISTDTVDNLDLTGSRIGIKFSTNTLNRKQYSSSGKHFYFSVDWFYLKETFTPGNTSVEIQSQTNNRNWLRARVTLEQYFRISKVYSTGYYFDGVFSNQPLLSNYQGSLINAPAFNPMQDSRSLLLRNFRSFNYVAGGWRNIISIYKNFDIRLEGYIFKPFEAILQGENQKGILDSEFSRFFFATTAGLVYHSPIGPISISANYYDDAYSDTQNQFGVIFHLGFLLFNKAALE